MVIRYFWRVYVILSKSEDDYPVMFYPLIPQLHCSENNFLTKSWELLVVFSCRFSQKFCFETFDKHNLMNLQIFQFQIVKVT